MRKIIFILIIFLAPINYRKNTPEPLIVAVIDTGFGYQGKGKEAKLCKYGHKNFTNITDYSMEYGTKDPIPADNHGHGTNIVGIIEKFANNAPYCIVIIKYFDPNADKHNSFVVSAKAINYANNIKADIINYSGGGIYTDAKETKAIRLFLYRGGILIAAAGNERSNLDRKENSYYPAMSDERVITVGNAHLLGLQESVNGRPLVTIPEGGMAVPSFSSNYGKKIKKWEIGEDIEGYGITMTGTSQSAAKYTGKLIKRISLQK